MLHNKRKHLFSLLLVGILLMGLYAFTLKEVIEFPNQIKIFQNEKQTLDIKFPFKLTTNSVDENILKLSNSENRLSKDEIHVNPLKIGKTKIQVKLFGVLPMKDVEVNVVPQIKVVPGGQSVGVKLNTKGVLVVGLEEIEGADGKKHNPGRKAGLSIGDSILEINDTKIKDAEHVIKMIDESKDHEIKLKVKREEKTFELSIKPVATKENREYRMGLWVRDKTAGVGTLTFFYPDEMKFGALGHAITDIDTGLLLTVNDGEVVKSKVASVKQGKKGKPGEIKGIFYNSSKPIGNLEKNTSFGIYGTACEFIENKLYKEPIEIAFQSEVKEGKATILTTIDNNEIESYEIYIEKVNHQRTPTTKSMIIRVTDKKLLSKSGGIVQGMSGSPIIQNGKLVGAVTHVFVNDPSKGYGLFIEWMINEAGIDIYNKDQIANKN